MLHDAGSRVGLGADHPGCTGDGRCRSLAGIIRGRSDQGSSPYAGPLHQLLRRRCSVAALGVVAEAVCDGFQHRKRLHVGPLLRRVGPGAKGTCTLCPASLAACSTPAHPAKTIRSARETRLPPVWAALNSAWIPSSVNNTPANAAGSFASQSFCGARRTRAPLAPPRLSVPRNDAAEAQAVETS